MSSTTAVSQTRKGPSVLLIGATALMLFSMFFGAGNLIFPPMIGVQSGEFFTPAIIGFLLTGVILPVLAIIAVAISGHNVRDLARRGGMIFGLVFPILAYLSIGAFYALPRTGAVSFNVAVTPLTGMDSILASAIFNFVFFGLAFALAYNPNTIVDKLGKILTPALLVLLAVLVVLVLFNFHSTPGAATGDFASSPLTTGLLEGYLTMDSIAGLAFGIVVISSLRTKGVGEGAPLVRSTIIAGVGAAVLLAIIYVSLGLIGQRVPNGDQYGDGADLLSNVAGLTMGTPGQVLFGGVVLLACLTTAVGLIAATSEFFAYLMPKITYRAWAAIFALASFGMASLGLDQVLAIAAPVISFLYPPAITLILLTMIHPLFKNKLSFFFTYRIAIWVAVVWSALSSLVSVGVSALEPLITWMPLEANDLGWVIPTAVGIAVGLAADIFSPRSHPMPEGEDPIDAAHEALSDDSTSSDPAEKKS